MVTGVETAGLVLATFPIVVSGLSHFAEGVDTIKSWRKYRRQLTNYARTLEAEYVIYRNTVEELLDGIIHSDEELNMLLEDPGGLCWQKPQYEDQLRRRLDHSYPSYLVTMTDILTAVQAVQKKLGLGDSGKILWDTYTSLEREIKRVKLVLSKNIYAGLLANIEKGNNSLQKLTQQNRYLEPVRQKRRSQRPSLDFKMIRRHATSLYNVLVIGRSWQCGCRKDRVASLRLEPRPVGKDTKTAPAESKLRFRVLLSKKRGDSTHDVSCECREIEVEPVEASPQPPLVSDNAVQAPSPGTLSIASKSDGAAAAKPKKSVQFAILQPARAILPSPSSISSKASLTPIIDICAAINNPNDDKQIGFLTDNNAGKHRYDIFSLDDKIQQDIDFNSLEHILKISQNSSPGFRLSRRDRLYTAVTLASSVLQLDGTSWLRRQWRSGDILFLRREDGSSASPKLDCAHPYVSWKVSSDDTNQRSLADNTATLTGHIIRSEGLFSLAIALIELCFGQTLSAMHIPEDDSPVEAITSFNTARRLLDNVYNESGSRYGDAVRRCLFCPFDLRDASLENEEFQQAVFTSIVTPLMQDLGDFDGSSRIR